MVGVGNLGAAVGAEHRCWLVPVVRVPRFVSRLLVGAVREAGHGSVGVIGAMTVAVSVAVQTAADLAAAILSVAILALAILPVAILPAAIPSVAILPLAILAFAALPVVFLAVADRWVAGAGGVGWGVGIGFTGTGALPAGIRLLHAEWIQRKRRSWHNAPFPR